MARPPSAAEARVARTRDTNQIDFFPQQVLVERLDVRDAAGEQSRVKAIFRVRYEREAAVHQVFHDRYGWYCADHGPKCKAVSDVKQGQRESSVS